MALLTLENTDTSRASFYDYKTFLEGQRCFLTGCVKIVDFDGETASCQVESNYFMHPVIVRATGKDSANITCDCQQFKQGRNCMHRIAALFAVRDYIEKTASTQWQYRLKFALEQAPRRKGGASTPARYAILFGLQKRQGGYYSDGYAYSIVPYRVRVQEWPGVTDLAKITDREEQTKKLDQDRSWSRFAQQTYSALDYRGVVNLPMEGVQIYNMLAKSYNYSTVDFAAILPIMASLDLPTFLMSNKGGFKQRLHWLKEPVQVESALAKDGDAYSLQAGLRLNGEVFTTIKGSLDILCTDPPWMLAGKYIALVENRDALNLLRYFPLTIPEAEIDVFREHYFREVFERIPVRGDVISWQDVDANPVPRIYLQDTEKTLGGSLRFAYGDYEVDADPKAMPETVLDIPGSWGMVRVHRQLDQEEQFYQMLTDARFGLKRAGTPQAPGMFELRARTHPLDFLLHSIPLLAQAGFEVFGEESLKAGRINRSRPTLSLNITSGLDWFDLKAVIHYDNQEVPLSELRKALRKRDRYIKLADGSIGLIPDEWLERYKKLFDLSEETGDGLRVHDYHLPLVDLLLEDANELLIADDFERRKNLLRSFEHIQPQPVPAGFVGELRPYQKAGLDWLHFLHQYGFGGCLADDMGLGKTIQVLAFLQSLKEQGLDEGPTLLVVPKSLLSNWQREGERFTPGLRFLEFVGNSRTKAAESFEGYDVIITTYGTMLRDVQFLREFCFHYVILDESQAIKNPLAQSSKAARLLQAGHRLVMTGTPVENNTFDLWSQFAFLNPGLLGSLDYFKQEFARSIEGQSAEEGLHMLRRLIYPFILRRTKEQVTPELPPRTERILYTELEPPQRKLYNHTREAYRSLLLGIIEDEGMADARMKILEGLLRLRQICIHPLMVDPNYRGNAAKFDLLLETLETLISEGHKALIFSQFVQTLTLLRRELDRRQIRYAYLDGQTENRQEQVDRFQSDSSLPLFLISLKAGGIGLNLTAADYVIHIDPWWNPAVEMQAADRAHRIGQDKPVFVYKIIARNTVEEKILQLQEKKRELVEQIIAADSSFFKSITKEDVKVLFS